MTSPSASSVAKWVYPSTGKTHEGIELAVQWWKQVFEDAELNLPILIICPIDVMPSWEAKFADQYPSFNVHVIDRKNRTVFQQALLNQDAEVYIMHWAAVNLLTDWFIKNKIVFSVVVADEVHKISNRDAQTSKNLKRIKTYSKLGLSGTASGDKPWNLWSVLNWLDAKTFSSYWRFVNMFVEEEYDWRGNSNLGDKDTLVSELTKYRVFKQAKNLPYLHNIMRHWYVRHLKAEQCCEHHPEGVMPFLPKKIHEHHFVELSPRQRKVYNEMEKEMVAWLDDGTPLVAPVIIAQLTRLSQIALAQPIIKAEEEMLEDGSIHVRSTVELEMPSSKFDVLKEIVTDYDEKPFVVFTSSKRMAYLVAGELERAGISNAVLSGDTNPNDRRGMVDAFNRGEFRIFIGVIAAVAEGIDGLQHTADTVIFLDRHRSAIKNQQAEDRLHRGGQKSTVTVIDIIAKDTLDEDWVLNRLPEKWARIREVLDIK